MPIPVVPCTPDHCGQTDVPMIFRSHSPRTCTARIVERCHGPHFDGVESPCGCDKLTTH